MKTFSSLLLLSAVSAGLSGCPVIPLPNPNEGEGEVIVEGEGEGEGEGESAILTETILLPGSVPLKMVFIPAGKFTMGSPETEVARDSDEGPQHTVTLSKGFWIGQYEFTQIQWKAVMSGANPSYFQGGAYGNTDNRPVEQVSWDVINRLFLPKINTATQNTFRLPTEAEWEYACRAGELDPQTRFYWGDDSNLTNIPQYAWYESNSNGQSHAIGSKRANAFGLYDMSGGVWEWVQDFYQASYSMGAVTNPGGPVLGAGRVLRGGAWTTTEAYCRSASRNYYTPTYQDYTFGFRVVRNP